MAEDDNNDAVVLLDWITALKYLRGRIKNLYRTGKYEDAIDGFKHMMKTTMEFKDTIAYLYNLRTMELNIRFVSKEELELVRKNPNYVI